MSQTILEVGFPPQDLSISGDVHLAEEFLGVSPVGQAPVRIIQSDQELYIKFNFKNQGTLVGALFGHWHLGVLFERIGPGDDPDTILLSLPDAILSTNLNETITVLPTHFNPILLQGQNVFRVTATLVFHREGAPFGLPIAGVRDLGIMQVFFEG